MYLLRRVAKAEQGKVWDVANLMSKICAAYEENGRYKAQVFVSQGLPGTSNVVYAEWTQESIQPNWPSKVPESVRTLNAQMFPMLTEPWSIEFFELVTPQKLEERNLS
tara:strand:- start:20 stop:343 length:324 start_codon:yes stop_codon:yes gene_type:complete